LYIITLNNTHTHTHTLGRNHLDEGSARCTDLYLTAYNTHTLQTPMPRAGFERAFPASEQPQTHAIDGDATEIGPLKFTILNLLKPTGYVMHQQV